jgi:hypothetical protein
LWCRSRDAFSHLTFQVADLPVERAHDQASQLEDFQPLPCGPD